MSAPIKSEDCTVAKQCPSDGDSCSYFNSDTSPLCPRNLAKAGYEIRCTSVGTMTTAVVGCKPGAPPAKTGMCQRSSVSPASSSDVGLALALALVVVAVHRRCAARR